MYEEELIQGVLEGSQRDFEQLVKKYEKNLFRTAIGFLHDRQDAEEVVQDVFLKVYRSLSTFDHRAGLATWLYRITVNESLNFLRRRKRRSLITSLTGLFGIPSPDGIPDKQLLEQDRKEIIRKALDKLPRKQRTAFVLMKYEEMSQKETARVMGTSEGAVEQLIIRARNNLKKFLSEKQEQP